MRSMLWVLLQIVSSFTLPPSHNRLIPAANLQTIHLYAFSNLFKLFGIGEPPTPPPFLYRQEAIHKLDAAIVRGDEVKENLSRKKTGASLDNADQEENLKHVQDEAFKYYIAAKNAFKQGEDEAEVKKLLVESQVYRQRAKRLKHFVELGQNRKFRLECAKQDVANYVTFELTPRKEELAARAAQTCSLAEVHAAIAKIDLLAKVDVTDDLSASNEPKPDALEISSRAGFFDDDSLQSSFRSLEVLSAAEEDLARLKKENDNR